MRRLSRADLASALKDLLFTLRETEDMVELMTCLALAVEDDPTWFDDSLKDLFSVFGAF